VVCIDARRRLQLEQLLPDAGRAAILRQRFRAGTEHRRQHCRGSHARHQAHRALKPQRHHGGGLYFPRVPRIDLLTVGEAFEDLVFVGLPHMPRSGEELRTSVRATIGGGALITATAASRLGLRTTVISALSAEAVRALRETGSAWST
jgi:Sugar kinases, ribokinase family